MKYYFTPLMGTVLALAATGCAARHTGVSLPTGHWVGEGAYLVNTWSSNDGKPDPATEIVRQGRYATDLRITPVEAPEGSVRLEIVSLHGKVEGLGGDRTHIIAVLTPRTPTAPEEIGRYRLSQSGFSDNEKEPQLDSGPPDLTTASAMLVEGDIVLCMQYSDGFIDLLRFHDGVAYKYGALCEKGKGFVHWSEVLRRK